MANLATRWCVERPGRATAEKRKKPHFDRVEMTHVPQTYPPPFFFAKAAFRAFLGSLNHAALWCVMTLGSRVSKAAELRKWADVRPVVEQKAGGKRRLLEIHQ